MWHHHHQQPQNKVSPEARRYASCAYVCQSQWQSPFADAAIQKSVENMTQLAPPQQQQTSIQLEFYFTTTKILETICMYVCIRTYPHLYHEMLFVVKKQICMYVFIQSKKANC